VESQCGTCCIRKTLGSFSYSALGTKTKTWRHRDRKCPAPKLPLGGGLGSQKRPAIEAIDTSSGPWAGDGINLARVGDAQKVTERTRCHYKQYRLYYVEGNLYDWWHLGAGDNGKETVQLEAT
jgi:hypothetical protein